MVEECRTRSKRVGEVGTSSSNVEKNKIEEIARIRRRSKVEKGREKSKQLVEGERRSQKVAG
jgi:hypothetical protein